MSEEGFGATRMEYARVQKEDLLATPAVPSLLRTRHVKQLSSDLLLRRQHDTIFGENPEYGSGVRDGLHRILD